MVLLIILTLNNIICNRQPGKEKLKFPISCYYKLPKSNDTDFLSPEKIPSKCTRVIIEGAKFVDGNVEFQVPRHEKIMDSFKNLNNNHRVSLVSIKCDKLGEEYNWGYGPTLPRRKS